VSLTREGGSRMNVVALPVQCTPQTQRSVIFLKPTRRSSACGHQNPPEAAFCGECGTQLSPRHLRRATCSHPNLARFKFCHDCGAGHSPALTLAFPSTTITCRSTVEPFSQSTPATLAQVAKAPSPQAETRDLARGTPLVGRESDIAQLQTWFETALQGERQVVFVTGEAGIGKTTLVDAFLAQLRERTDVSITSGQCVEQYGPGEAYLPLLEATARLCRGPGRARRIAALKRYAPSWLVQLPGLLDPEDRARLQQHVQGTSQERMLREMAEAAELFTAQHGLVVVLEDLHWSDVATLDWLTYVARRREPAKLMILGTYRPTDVLASNHPLRAVVQELTARNRCEEVRVAPLSERSVGEYLTRRFSRSVAASPLPGLIHRRTGGNPLFVVNVADDLLQQGIVREEAGQWQVRGDELSVTESVPDTLRQAIGRQVERLPLAAQQLLEVASILGVEFSAAAVAAGLQAAVEEVDRQCASLARQGQFILARGNEEWPDNTLSERYSFQHALYQAVLAERVTETQKVRVHRRVGERKALAYGERAREIAAELAVHFEAGREYAKAVQYRRQAGEAAARRSAHQEALSHFRRGLELLTLLPDGPERIEQEVRLQLALANPLYALGGRRALEEMEHAYLRAYELCQPYGESPQLASILFGLCMVYELRGEAHKGFALAEQLLTLAQKVQKPGLLLRAHMALGNASYFLGDFPASRHHLEQALAIYDPDKYSPRVSNIAQDLGVVCASRAAWVLWCLGYPAQARRSSDQGMALARELSHGFSETFALDGAVGMAHVCGDLPAVEQHVERMITLSQEQGFPYSLLWGTMMRGWLLSVQGQGGEGIAQLRRGVDALRKGGLEIGLLYFMGLLAEAYGRADKAEEGLAVLSEALEVAGQRGERFCEAELYRRKGTLMLQSKVQGPRSKVEEEAEECFRQAVEIARRQQAKSLELRAAVSLARLWQRQGKILEAREVVEEIYHWFTEGFDTKDLQDAAALLTELGGSVKTREEKRETTPAEGSRLKAEGQPPFSPSSLEPVASRLSDPAPSTPHLTFPPNESRPPTADAGRRTPDAIFRPEGEYWTVNFAGTTCRLKDARGLHYIAHLLQQPHQEVHVITLITVGADLREDFAETHSFHDPSLQFDHIEGCSDAGEILDLQARAAYKQRLRELREELTEAEQLHDLGRSEQLAAELDFLTHELSSAVGLGGRARRAGSPAERARVNITRAIKLALRKIGEHHPALGQHLTTTIKTGAYCSYTPDVRVPITWQG
jgi:predicted ATPase